jgi:hypothetical protein
MSLRTRRDGSVVRTAHATTPRRTTTRRESTARRDTRPQQHCTDTGDTRITTRSRTVDARIAATGTSPGHLHRPRARQPTRDRYGPRPRTRYLRRLRPPTVTPTRHTNRQRSVTRDCASGSRTLGSCPAARSGSTSVTGMALSPELAITASDVPRLPRELATARRAQLRVPPLAAAAVEC